MHRIFKLVDFLLEMEESMRRLKKYLIGLGIFLVIFTVFGFFGLPPILKSILTKKLSREPSPRSDDKRDKDQSLYTLCDRKGFHGEGPWKLTDLCLF